MKLILKSENGTTLNVSVLQSDTFLDLKRRLFDEHGVDVDIQNFSIEGRPIDNNFNILKYFHLYSETEIDEKNYLETQICRLCGEMCDIKSMSDILLVKETITKYLHLKVDAHNVLSNMVCNLCIKKLDEFKIFINTCLNAEKKQLEIIKNHKSNCPFCFSGKSTQITFVNETAFCETSIRHKKYCLNITESTKSKIEWTSEICKQKSLTLFCPICQKDVSPSECVLGKCHNFKTFCCFVCKLTFKNGVEFKEHFKNHLAEDKCACRIDEGVIHQKCNFCIKVFLNPKNCQIHVDNLRLIRNNMIHSEKADDTLKLNKENFYCGLCSKVFRSKKRLEFHIEFHLKTSKAGQCVVCQKEFSSEIYLYKHMLHNHLRKKVFTCELCGKTFRNKSSLTYHSRSHESFEAMRPFSCTICDKRFVRKNILRDHVINRHGGGRDSRPSSCFQCRVCKEAFPNTNSGISHMEIHHPDQVDDKAGYSFDMQTVSKLFSCEFCDKCYPLLGELAEHRLRHRSSPQYQCKMCNEEFSSFIEMRTHFDEHISDGMSDYKTDFTVPTMFVCEFCEKSFKSFHAFSTHSSSHTGSKPYICRFCSEVFSSYGEVQNHRTTHKNMEKESVQLSNTLRPFDCQYCKKSFTSNSSLTKHVRIHTGEKPFCCQVCNKTFTQSSGLYTHLKVHSNERPYKCDLCTKSYKILGDYKKHVRGHSELKRFRCDVCYKSFASQRTLNQHTVRH